MVGRWVSFWDWLFLGAMLNFTGVAIQKRVGRIRSANAGRLAWFLCQNQSSTGQIFLRKAAKSPTYFGLIILSLLCYLPTSQAWCRDFWHKEVLPRAKDAQLAVVLWRLCKVTSQKLGLSPLFPWNNFPRKKNSCENMPSAKWVFFWVPPKNWQKFCLRLKMTKTWNPCHFARKLTWIFRWMTGNCTGSTQPDIVIQISFSLQWIKRW